MRVFDDDGMLTPAADALLAERFADEADDTSEEQPAEVRNPFDSLDLALALAAVSDDIADVVHR